MKELKNRLVYLFTGELFSVVVFTLVYLYYVDPFARSYSLIYVLVVLNLILLQGSFYWYLKWKCMKQKRTLPFAFLQLLPTSKKGSLMLLCAAPIVLLVEYITGENLYWISYVLYVLVYLFAIIEYINYFHVQLTNYKGGRGKTSSIAKEIARLQKS